MRLHDFVAAVGIAIELVHNILNIHSGIENYLQDECRIGSQLTIKSQVC